MSSTSGNNSQTKRKEIYKYEAPWMVYAMNWSIRPDKRFRLALGSFVEEYNNKVSDVRSRRACQSTSNPFAGPNRVLGRGELGVHRPIDVRSSLSNNESHVDTRYGRLPAFGCSRAFAHDRLRSERCFSRSAGDQWGLSTRLANRRQWNSFGMSAQQRKHVWKRRYAHLVVIVV